ncbi:MAG: tyrosine-type recombinase/integrase [Candidatus Binatia bacterium]
MSRVTSLTSPLGPCIADYLALKCALGRKYAVEQKILEHLDAFLNSCTTDLTAETFMQWCRTREHLTSGVRRTWMRVVRNLCLYRRRTDSDCFVPDPSQFPLPHQSVRPHIFTETEITRLLTAAGGLQPTAGSPLRSENFRLAIALLYTTGLRRGELLRLTVGDYDPAQRTLLVRESKFHKSRLLPLSSDPTREVDTYLQIRRARRLPTAAEAPLIWNRYGGGKAYTGVGFGSTIQALFRAAQIHTAGGGRPRVHDFRHCFAVHALLRWYRTGADVQAKLPLLATYMGHVSIVSTEYYLRFVEELAASASERFDTACGALVTPIPKKEGTS